MRRLRRFLARVVNFVTRRDDLRLREEMEGHLCEQAGEYVRAGMSPDEARRQAVLKFGAVEAVREKYHVRAGASTPRRACTGYPLCFTPVDQVAWIYHRCRHYSGPRCEVLGWVFRRFKNL